MGKVVRHEKKRPRLTNVENCELGRVKGQKQVCGVDLKSLRKNMVASHLHGRHMYHHPPLLSTWERKIGGLLASENWSCIDQ